MNRIHRRKASQLYGLIYVELNFPVAEKLDRIYRIQTVFHPYEYARKEENKSSVEISYSSIIIIIIGVNLSKRLLQADTHPFTLALVDICHDYIKRSFRVQLANVCAKILEMFVNTESMPIEMDKS